MSYAAGAVVEDDAGVVLGYAGGDGYGLVVLGSGYNP